MASSAQHYRILLVEDDKELASLVAEYLTPHGFEVGLEYHGESAAKRILDEHPDAVLLDVNLPGADGFSVCRAVRSDYHGAIIMLTARNEEVDEVVGLEVGADDYIVKPVRPRALLARLRMHLRRTDAPEPSGQSVRVGSLVIDPTTRSAEIDGQAVDLTTAEFDLLLLLAENAGQPLSRNEIYLHIHGVRYDGLDRSIDLRVSRLRKKLGDDPAKPRRIKSIRGVGYILTVES